jgi:hypothetical protein
LYTINLDTSIFNELHHAFSGKLDFEKVKDKLALSLTDFSSPKTDRKRGAQTIALIKDKLITQAYDTVKAHL